MEELVWDLEEQKRGNGMISTMLRIVLLMAIIIYFILILFYLKKKALELKYTLLWLLAGMIMLLMVMFPQVSIVLTKLLGFESNMNALYITCIGFVIMLLLMVTSIVSRQSNKIKTLVQEISILEKRIRELENSQMNN